MSLRCKKGDLAIVVRSRNGNEGTIVEVLEFVGSAISRSGVRVTDVWLVSIRGERKNAKGVPYAFQDSALLPIRPGDLKETEETEKEAESVVS